jgi:hypothetical protein
MPVRKNAAHDIPFALVNATEGTPLTGASVTVYRVLDGGAQSVAGGSVVEKGSGQYVFEGVAADFNADYSVGFLFTASGAVPVHVLLQMTYFRKDTAYDIPFLLVDVRNSSALTGASPAGKRCLDGGAQASVTGSFVERGNGQYVFQAAVADFDADDVIGFLVTATNAVPKHLIIDLLEAYTVNPLLGDSPASVLATYLTGQALMIVPGAVGDWPLYISSLPDGDNVDDNAGAIYDTAPIKDGRYMGDGEVVNHYGIQLKIRSRTFEEGWDKMNTIAVNLDQVDRQEVTKNSVDYLIQNISRASGVTSLGIETVGTKRRNLFVLNLLMTMEEA